MCSYLESNSQTCLWTLSNCRIVELSNREESLAKSYFIEVLPEGGIATLEARLRSRGNKPPHPNSRFRKVCNMCNCEGVNLKASFTTENSTLQMFGVSLCELSL